MKDFIENLEDAAEKHFDKMTEGLKPGYFKCDCGRIDRLENAQPCSPNPYSMPICGQCFEEWYNEIQANKKRNKNSRPLGTDG